MPSLKLARGCKHGLQNFATVRTDAASALKLYKGLSVIGSFTGDSASPTHLLEVNDKKGSQRFPLTAEPPQNPAPKDRVRPAAMLGFQGLPMMAWEPAVFFLAALSTGSLQEVHMAHHTSTRGFLFSVVRSIGSVLTSVVGSALLI